MLQKGIYFLDFKTRFIFFAFWKSSISFWKPLLLIFLCKNYTVFYSLYQLLIDILTLSARRDLMEQKYLTSAKLDKKLTFLLLTATKWYNSEITKTTSTRQDKHTTCYKAHFTKFLRGYIFPRLMVLCIPLWKCRTHPWMQLQETVWLFYKAHILLLKSTLSN